MMPKAKQEPIWKNRIVGEGEMPANQFLANKYNFRRHPANQREALRGSLSELGWIQRVVINKTTGNLIDGHARIEEALSQDEQMPVPYIEVELSESEEKLALAILDPMSAMATADREVLDMLLRDVSTGEAALQQMLSELAAKNGLIPPNDVNEHWQGMPEFYQEDQDGEYTIKVHFESKDDLDRFSQLVQQEVTEKTKYIWFPYKAPDNLQECIVEDES